MRIPCHSASKFFCSNTIGYNTCIKFVCEHSQLLIITLSFAFSYASLVYLIFCFDEYIVSIIDCARFVSVPCPSPGCTSMVPRRLLDEHLEQCEHRVKECPKGCGESAAINVIILLHLYGYRIAINQLISYH